MIGEEKLAKIVGGGNIIREQATLNEMAKVAFFSRPCGESVGMIINRDAATVVALKKVKAVVDPNNIMNPGKLHF